jgi:uncharacterized protein YbaR (Trm112 family)
MYNLTKEVFFDRRNNMKVNGCPYCKKTDLKFVDTCNVYDCLIRNIDVYYCKNCNTIFAISLIVSDAPNLGGVYEQTKGKL